MNSPPIIVAVKSGAAAERSYPVSEARRDGQEELPHVQGAVAAEFPAHRSGG